MMHNGRNDLGNSNALSKKALSVPSKVHDLRVRAVGATTLLITWQPPRQPNGNIRGYFLTFESLSLYRFHRK